MAKRVAFTKPALSIEQQIELLRSRGLVIDDEEQARHHLKFVGYFRLVGYARHYRGQVAANPEQYLPGTSFQQVLDLYVFDRRLRVLLLDAFERIEIAIKAAMTDTIAVPHGAFWLSDANNFDRGMHQSVIEEINNVMGSDPSRNTHAFIAHFHSKYLEPYPPSWMLMECLSFSAVSRIYKMLRGAHRQAVSAEFKLQHDILESWLHALSYTRNICAHHSRLWQRSFTIQPKIPRQYQSIWPQAQAKKLYIVCCMVHHMMQVIADGSKWAERLRRQINARPEGISPALMGFPEDWETQSFWGFGRQ